MNKIGFGFFRLPQTKAGTDDIDWPLLNRMTDTFLCQMKAKGKAKRIGFSYHDNAVLMNRILTAHLN